MPRPSPCHASRLPTLLLPALLLVPACRDGATSPLRGDTGVAVDGASAMPDTRIASDTPTLPAMDSGLDSPPGPDAAAGTPDTSLDGPPASLDGETIAGLFVAPTGDDTNPGTLDRPFKTLVKALATAAPGSQVWVRGGSYQQTARIMLSAKGTAAARTRVWAYGDEVPLFDFTGQTTTGASGDGLSIAGSYLHFRGFEVAHASHNGVLVSGANNIIEGFKLHDNRNTGLHIRGVSAANNLILNCDSYLNYDPPIGGDADGFSAKWEVGEGNIFRGCRAYNNSDDGWDLWMADHAVLIEDSWAFNNGVDSWHQAGFNGNGNGFKLGGNNVATPHTVRRSLAFANVARGFDENNNLAGQTVLNCSAFQNGTANYHFGNTVTLGAHLFRNNLSLAGTVNITSGTHDHNSWDTGPVATAADFQGIDPTGADGPRDADGGLPRLPFLRLVPGSQLIDAGVDVQLPFAGGAPDLGCYEAD